MLITAAASAPVELKFQIANESNISSDLMLELELVQHSGAAAQHLAKLKHELSQREEELTTQQCRSEPTQ